jgi:hypothetical protein
VTVIPIVNKPKCARTGCGQDGRAYLVTEDLLVYRVCLDHMTIFSDKGGTCSFLPPITAFAQYPAKA